MVPSTPKDLSSAKGSHQNGSHQSTTMSATSALTVAVAGSRAGVRVQVQHHGEELPNWSCPTSRNFSQLELMKH